MLNLRLCSTFSAFPPKGEYFSKHFVNLYNMPLIGKGTVIRWSDTKQVCLLYYNITSTAVAVNK